MTKNGKRNLLKDLTLAAAVIAAGGAISGFAAADLLGHKMQFAQATQPLQSTPGAEAKPSAPNTTGESQGARPAEVAPEPARPDADAQKAGAAPVLPPAPAEKTAAPIPAR